MLRWEPNHREKIWSYFWDMACKVRWKGCLSWWRLGFRLWGKKVILEGGSLIFLFGTRTIETDKNDNKEGEIKKSRNGSKHDNGAGRVKVLSLYLDFPTYIWYPYLISDGFKFIISSPYPSGIGYSWPVPYTIQLKKYYFFL